jgi:signal transduction histidine kinase
VLEGDLFSTSTLNPIYILNQSSSDIDQYYSQGFEEVTELDQADITCTDQGMSLFNDIIIDWDEFDNNLVEIRKACEFNRLERRKNSSVELEDGLYKMFQEGELSEASYWKFLRVCYEISLEYNKLEDIFYRVVRHPDFKKLFDADLYDNQQSMKKGLGAEFVIYVTNELAIIGQALSEGQSAEVAGALFAFINFLDNWQSEKIVKKSLGEEISLKEVFSLVDYPMVVLDQEGIVNLLNDKFSALSILPSNLIEHREIGWIEYQNERFKILHEDINERFCLYTLVKQESETDHSIEGQSELGIISGSIAHELNNPVGGILAAITLLELEEWDDENITALKEMKDSGLRCKGLIETFLGFSRYRGFGPVIKALGIVLEQSTSLLRYRIVESGLAINVDADDELNSEKIKASVMPMVFYLLFNEMLTILSHKLLLVPGLGKVINLRMERSDNELWIINESFEYDSDDLKKFDIKLIAHLMEMEKMSFVIDEGIIKIIGIYED